MNTWLLKLKAFFNNKRRVIDVYFVEYVVLFSVHLVEEKRQINHVFIGPSHWIF